MTESSVALNEITEILPVRGVSQRGLSIIRASMVSTDGYLENYPVTLHPHESGSGYILIDGNHRLEIAKERQLKQIPCIIKTGLTREEMYRLANQSNDASEAIVKATLWTRVMFCANRRDEKFTQSQTAKMLNWENASGQVRVAQYLAVNDRLCQEAKEVIITTFDSSVIGQSEDVVIDNITTVIDSPFTEGLLRNILDLTADQQLELCRDLVKGEKNDGISKGRFNVLANSYRARNEMIAVALEKLAGIDDDLVQSVLAEIRKGAYDDDWIKQAKPKGKNGKGQNGDAVEAPAHPEKLTSLIQGAMDAWNKKTSIKMIHGDFYECVKDVPSDSVNLILTDPPYNIAHDRKVTRYNAADVSYDFGAWDRKGEAEFLENMQEWTRQFARILKPGGTGIIFTSSAFISDLRRLLVDAGLKPKQDLYWCKANPVQPPQLTGYITSVEVMVLFIKGDSGQTFTCKDYKEAKNFFDFPICGGNERIKDGKKDTLHPTQKPEALIKRLMENSSYSNDLVFDGFMGVGTTAKVAKNLGRKFIGIELDDEYFAAAQRRIA